VGRLLWQVVVAAIVIAIAVRVGTALDRSAHLSPAAKWSILAAVVLAAALFLSLLTPGWP
jgi:uncharacterized membrane protein YoaK (UPF0700 family)